ncbi:MAG: formylglycine-generating enzyme family protein [Fibromonadaceae bacterium]|nr:formylglycine-generating enzyme family protein [Fibromonadaceae bacterium]
MKVLVSIVFVFSLSFAKQYGFYDLQGNRISTFEAEPHELPEKTRQIKNGYPGKTVYVSSLQKSKASKPSSRYRYKAETGAYIETSRKETFSICPDKIEGTWVSEHSVALNTENCLSVRAPNLAGTFSILFSGSGRTDTIQILVGQSYIQMGDYSHKVWVQVPNDSMPWHCKDGNVCGESEYGHYENRKYSQPLIVDKTEFTMGDAQYYSEFDPKLIPSYFGSSKRTSEAYPPNENLKTSARPYVVDNYDSRKIANMRSKLEGLDTVYILVPNGKGNTQLIVDTSASGYRLPFKDEWGMLMRAGASTRYYWGNEEDSLTVSRYSLVRPVGYAQHKVAQKQPNAFGLYDMISQNNTNMNYSTVLCNRSGWLANQMRECRFLAGEIARQVEGPKVQFSVIDFADSLKSYTKEPEIWLRYDFSATSTRLLRKTPKLHKLEKF